MNGIVGTIAAAAAMFAATNIDGAVVLTVLNAASRATGTPQRWHIWAGAYTGIGLMVVVSLLAALGLRVVPLYWVGLLGLIPFTQGIIVLTASIRAVRSHDPDPPAVATGLFSVTAVMLGAPPPADTPTGSAAPKTSPACS